MSAANPGFERRAREISAGPVPLRLRVLLTLAHAGLALTVAIGVAVPVLSYRYAHHVVLLGTRAAVPSVNIPAIQLAQYRQFAVTGPATFVSLGYDDIGTHTTSSTGRTSETVQASSLAAQLAMLRTAGFVSVDAADVAGYLAGHVSLPKHAVLLSFDGARERDWTQADRMLQKYGDTAVVFVDPGEISGHKTPYLSWTQLRAMVSSGRWAIGLDLSDAAQQVAIDARGTKGPAVVEHAWLPAAGRAETAAQYQARITTLVDRELSTLQRQRLPRPQLVSLPFAAGYPLARVTSTFDQLVDVLGGMFSASLLDLTPDQSVDKSYASERLLPRLQVYRSTSTAELFSRIEAAS